MSHRALVRATLGAAIVLTVCGQLWAQSVRLAVERDGDRLRLSAPDLHFLAGKPLERLHDGGSVVYVVSVTVHVERGESGGARLTQRVVFSYDLWEEKFSVVQADAPHRSSSHLTAFAAEAWCLDLLKLPVRAALASKSFVVKLECTSPVDDAQPGDAPSGATLTALIDVFSRNARAVPPRWEAVSRPLRLEDLKDKSRK
jgi:hypothetical protein